MYICTCTCAICSVVYLNRYLDHTPKTVKKHGKVLVVSSDASGSALEFAKKANADVLVVGSRGLGAFKRFFLGSFSQDIVTNAEGLSVVVVKPLDVAEEEAEKKKAKEKKEEEDKAYQQQLQQKKKHEQATETENADLDAVIHGDNERKQLALEEESQQQGPHPIHAIFERQRENQRKKVHDRVMSDLVAKGDAEGQGQSAALPSVSVPSSSSSSSSKPLPTAVPPSAVGSESGPSTKRWPTVHPVATASTSTSTKTAGESSSAQSPSALTAITDMEDRARADKHGFEIGQAILQQLQMQTAVPSSEPPRK